jgi:hypothetical protein
MNFLFGIYVFFILSRHKQINRMNMERTFTRDETVFLHNNKVTQYDEDHINRLLKQCNVSFDKGGNKEKMGSVIFLLQDNTKGFSDANKVVASLQVSMIIVNGKYIAEIYNVCVSQSLVENPIEVTGFMVEDAILRLKSEKISKELDVLMWIGIDVENRNFLSIIHNLIKLHFITNGIQENRRPSGNLDKDNTIVSLVRPNSNSIPGDLPVDVSVINKQTGMISYMHSKFHSFIARCSKIVTISPKLALGLRKLAFRDEGEVSGFLYLTKKKYSAVFEGEYVMGGAITGPNPDLVYSTVDKCLVDIPQHNTSRIIFHTHPYSCYELYGLQIGWPSGLDFSVAIWQFANNDEVYAHLTISVEGIYAIRPMKDMSDNLQKKLNSSSDIILKFRSAVLEYWERERIDDSREFKTSFYKDMFNMNPHENYKLYQNVDTNPRVIDAIRGVKAITYQQIIKDTNFEADNNLDNDSSDFPLIYLEYWDWQKIKDEGLSFAIIDKNQVSRDECIQWDIDDIPVGKEITV